MNRYNKYIRDLTKNCSVPGLHEGIFRGWLGTVTIQMTNTGARAAEFYVRPGINGRSRRMNASENKEDGEIEREAKAFRVSEMWSDRRLSKEDATWLVVIEVIFWVTMAVAFGYCSLSTG